MQENHSLSGNERRSIRRPDMDAAMEQIDLIELALILLENWWKLLIGGLLGALLAYLLASSRYVPKYQATAKMYVNNNKISIGVTQVSISTGDLSASTALVETYQQFLNTHYVLDAIGKYLEEKGMPGYNYYNLAGRISTQAAGSTQFLNITAWDNSPENAVALVNALVEMLPDLAENVVEGSSIHAIDPAYTANLLASNVRKNTFQGGALGLALAAAAILGYYYFLNDVIRGSDWLYTTYPQVPSLGIVPDTTQDVRSGYGYGYGDSGKKKKKSRKKSTDFGPNLDFFGTEAYNVVRTNVKFSFYGSDSGKIVGITSSMPGDGKSYTSVNLAYALAKDNSKVLLIDGDMRKLTLSQFFRKTAPGGLSEVLCKQIPLESAVQRNVLHEKQSVLFSGKVPPNPSELLGSQQMQRVLEVLRPHFDYILIDLPPVSGVIDAVAVSKYLDGMIMIVRHDHTRKKYIRSTIRQLELAKVRLLGFVYNADVEKVHLYGGKYKKYYSAYQKEEESDGEKE